MSLSWKVEFFNFLSMEGGLAYFHLAENDTLFVQPPLFFGFSLSINSANLLVSGELRVLLVFSFDKLLDPLAALPIFLWRLSLEAMSSGLWVPDLKHLRVSTDCVLTSLDLEHIADGFPFCFEQKELLKPRGESCLSPAFLGIRNCVSEDLKTC